MRRFHLAAAAAFFLAVEAARSDAQPFNHVLRARDVLSLPFVSSPSADTPTSLMVRRQSGVVSQAGDNQAGIMLNPQRVVDMDAWNTKTASACSKTLGGITRSKDPSGTCICYNLPSLDTSTGVFEADLRLYSCSGSYGDFANVSKSDIDVDVKYNGAAVSRVSASQLAALSSNQKSQLAPRQDVAKPQLLQKYMFVGQIDKAMMNNNMSMAALESLLTPTTTLTANTTARQVSTNPSMNEASFLTGVFSKQVVMSNFAAAQAAVDAKLDALHNGTAAFVLPGVQILIFPIGLVITSVWLLLGLAAYGFGTYERIKYAQSYKRRQRKATAIGGEKSF